MNMSKNLNRDTSQNSISSYNGQETGDAWKKSFDFGSSSRLDKQRVVKSGYLKQRGVFSTWSKYFFVLNGLEFQRYRNEKLIYSSLQPDEEYDFASLPNVELMNAESLCGKKNSFALLIPSKSPVIFRANDEKEFHSWMSALKNVINSSNKNKLNSSSSSLSQSFISTSGYSSSSNGHQGANGVGSGSSASIETLEAIVDACVISDSSGIIVGFNQAAEELFGYKKEEVVNYNVKILMTQGHARNHDQYMRNYEKSGSKKLVGLPRKLNGLRKNGTTFPVVVSLGEVRVNGKLTFVAMFRPYEEKKNAGGWNETLSNIIVGVADREQNYQKSDLEMSLMEEYRQIFQYMTSERENLQQKIHSMTRSIKDDIKVNYAKIADSFESVQHKLKDVEKKNADLCAKQQAIENQVKILQTEVSLLTSGAETYHISTILESKYAFNRFLDFCKVEKVEEALLFLEETRKFKLMCKLMDRRTSKNRRVNSLDDTNNLQSGSPPSSSSSSSTSPELIEHLLSRTTVTHRDDEANYSQIAHHLMDPHRESFILTDEESTKLRDAQQIFDNFLKDTAPRQVNVGAKLVKELEQNLLSAVSGTSAVTANFFDNVNKDLIFTLDPAYRKFSKSDTGRAVIESLPVLLSMHQ